MNAYTSSAVAILTLAMLAGPVAAEPDGRAQRTPRHNANRPQSALSVGRLIDRLLGKPQATAEPAADVSTTATDEDPSDRGAMEESAEPAPVNLAAPAAATPSIDLDASRPRVSEGRSTMVLRSPGPATQAAIELDESVTMPVIDDAPPANSGQQPAAIVTARPRTEPAQVTSRPIAPAAPLITARPAPPPVQAPLPAQTQAPTPAQTEPPAAEQSPSPASPATASAVVSKPRRPSTSAFLSDDVRFGPVVRQTRPAPLPVEEAAIEPEVTSKSFSAHTIVPSRLHVMPPSLAPPALAAEDFAAREPLRPIASAETSPGRAEFVQSAPVAADASPGQILQAVHFYGAPQVAPTLQPMALEPTELPAAPQPPSPSVAPAQSIRPGAVQQTPVLEPTLADPPAAPSAGSVLPERPTAAASRPATRRAVRGKVLHGEVSRVNPGAGYVIVTFQEGDPAEGSRASVYRRRLFQRKHLGDVEIFVNPAGELCARPQGGLKLSDLAMEDELIVLPQVVGGDSEREATESAPQL